MLLYPKLISTSDFPIDTKIRAEEILSTYDHRSLGAYTDSVGNALARKTVAEFLEKRDGFVADPDDIILLSGATDGIHKLFELFAIKESALPAGVLVPSPGYPLYRSVVKENQMHPIRNQQIKCLCSK